MKKTVIAAALASTVFSGAAMAWTAGGTGGNIEIGGNIQVTPYSTPWEVLVGAPATNLDANITKGTKAVMIPVTKAIQVLGIRTVSRNPIDGVAGISPQINFHDAVQLDGFVKGITTVNLPVVDADDPTTQIGIMEAPFAAAAQAANNAGSYYDMYAEQAPHGFFGGLGKNASKIADNGGALVESISTFINDNFNDMGSTNYSKDWTAFANAGTRYSGFYGSGIQAGNNIKLTLSRPAANDVIKWKASMPITVSYQ
ncbi:fimbrial protein [Salmonella enterica subsp. enterica serovar Havana]|nr:fimbrial protein [Salmonella enterica]EBX0470819.1 fimbrial protein [Salmonella enterica subsp. enterica serovar Havana]EDW2266137.1 fimbrial protein [Salmonella enterica subsp. enterica serovar Oranienburg]EAY1111207.1 fimbrial protein [Salmonella enterica]EBP0885494.1 fimbrial protein [Salmonella enterica]